MVLARDTPIVRSRRLPSCGRLIRATIVSPLRLAPVFVEHKIYCWCRYLLLRRFLSPVVWPRYVMTLSPDFYVGSSIMCSRRSALRTWSLVASHVERCIALAREYPFVVRDTMIISLGRVFAMTARWPVLQRALMFEVSFRIDDGPSYDKLAALRCVEAYKTVATEVLSAITATTGVS